MWGHILDSKLKKYGYVVVMCGCSSFMPQSNLIFLQISQKYTNDKLLFIAIIMIIINIFVTLC